MPMLLYGYIFLYGGSMLKDLNTLTSKITGGLCNTCRKSTVLTLPERLISYQKYTCKHNKSIHIEEGKPTPCKYYVIRDNIRVNIASKKIGYQFPDTPEGSLMYSIIDQAIADALRGESSAIKFLTSTIPHAEICGVDSKWVQEVLIKCGILSKQQIRGYII